MASSSTGLSTNTGLIEGSHEARQEFQMEPCRCRTSQRIEDLDRRRNGRHRPRLQPSTGLARRQRPCLVVGQNFRDADMPGIEFIKADLSLVREAQRVARLLPAEELDLIIFTTGIMAGPTR